MPYEAMATITPITAYKMVLRPLSIFLGSPCDVTIFNPPMMIIITDTAPIIINNAFDMSLNMTNKLGPQLLPQDLLALFWIMSPADVAANKKAEFNMIISLLKKLRQ
jgi:hypothetical protein